MIFRSECTECHIEQNKHQPFIFILKRAKKQHFFKLILNMINFQLPNIILINQGKRTNSPGLGWAKSCRTCIPGNTSVWRSTSRMAGSRYTQESPEGGQRRGGGQRGQSLFEIFPSLRFFSLPSDT